AARGQRLAICDGDGQHDLQQLPRLLALMDEGAELAAASRYIDGETGLTGARDTMSRLATRATTSLLIGGLTDPMSGFFVMSRAAYEAARPRLSGVGFKILVDVVASSPRRLTLREAPAVLRAREHGTSKLDLRVIADLGALLVEKKTNGLIPVRLAMFGAVGVSGVAVHMATLSLLHLAGPFALAQAGAILVAMSWNFWINNILTFRDVRLKGAAMWKGLLSFYVACLGGGLISEGLATLLHNEGFGWMAAGASGALAAGLWNYYASRRATWGVGKPARAPANAMAAPEPLTTND
ncbi:MAG: glycosyl transferase family 2, partial [Caulobacteraceae bacterium]|nr:glycosyl transferase family 2 [Caulobacteraceae bacterium]